MKTVNETFTDEEWIELKQAKGNRSWHDFMLEEARFVKKMKEER